MIEDLAFRQAIERPQSDRWIDAIEHDRSAGVALACELAHRIAESGAFHGVHLIPGFRYRETATRLEKERIAEPAVGDALPECTSRRSGALASVLHRRIQGMARTDTASRVIAAPLARVYAALLDRLALMAWLPPKGMTARFERFDPRPGGSYRLVLTYGDAGRCSGEGHARGRRCRGSVHRHRS